MRTRWRASDPALLPGCSCVTVPTPRSPPPPGSGATTHAGAAIGPPSTNDISTMPSIANGIGANAQGTALMRHGTVSSTGQFGNWSDHASPTQTPMNMHGKIWPPTNPEPRLMPSATALSAAVPSRKPVEKPLP